LPFVAHATYEIQDTDITGFPTIAMDDPFDGYHYGGEHENAHKYQALTQQSVEGEPERSPAVPPSSV